MLIPWSYLSHQDHGKQLLSQLLGAASEWEGIKAAVSGAGLRGTGRRGLCQHAAVCVCVIEVLLRCNSRSWLGQLVAHRVSFSGELQLEINELTKKKSPGKLQAWDGHRVPASCRGPLGCRNPVRCTASPHCSAPHSQDAAPATPVPTAASRPAPRAAGGLGGGEGRGVSEAPDGSGAARHRVTPPCPEVRRQRRWSGGQRPGCTGAASGRSATGGELGAVRCGQRWGSASARRRPSVTATPSPAPALWEPPRLPASAALRYVTPQRREGAGRRGEAFVAPPGLRRGGPGTLPRGSGLRAWGSGPSATAGPPPGGAGKGGPVRPRGAPRAGFVCARMGSVRAAAGVRAGPLPACGAKPSCREVPVLQQQQGLGCWKTCGAE